MDQLPPADQPGFDLYGSHRSRLLGANIVLIILPTTFVILRLASRKVSRAGYWWDDLLIIIALIFSYGLTTCNLVSTQQYGLGRHIYILPPSSTPKFLQILYAFEMCFFLTSCFNKLSILAFYRRIFPISQLRIVLLATTFIVLSFSITCLMVVVFQCVPIHAFWDVQDRKPGLSRCINVDVLFLASGGVNTALDFFLVLIVSSRNCVSQS